MRKIFSKKAVTLMEIMVVIITLSLLAGFVIPTWQKSLDESDEKAAISNLMVLRGAFELYFSHNGDFGYSSGLFKDMNYWNEILKIHIIDGNLVYSCLSENVSDIHFECKALKNDSGGNLLWSVGNFDNPNLSNDLDGKPYCLTPPLCPNCQSQALGGCPMSL